MSCIDNVPCSCGTGECFKHGRTIMGNKNEKVPECHLNNCHQPSVGRCHASCCSGEGPDYCQTHQHNAQMYLDRIGYTSGFFGDKHEQILEVVEKIIYEVQSDMRDIFGMGHDDHD